MNDATEIALLSLPYYLSRCPSTVLQDKTIPAISVFHRRATWSAMRTTNLSCPILFVLITLSLSGYNYRRYGFTVSTNPKVVEYLKDWEGRSEGRAEKWTRSGLVVGAIGGSMAARALAAKALVRPASMFVGFTIFSGYLMNSANHEIYRQFRI